MTGMQGGADYAPLEFTVRRDQLAQLVDWVLPAVPAGATQPVNGCFLVRVSPAALSLAGAGDRMSISAEMLAVRTASEGTAFIPARKLKAMLAGPEPGGDGRGDVTVTVKGNYATVTAGGAAWSLKLPPAGGYMGLPDLSGAVFSRVSRDHLLAALSTVRHAIGKDAGRPAFTQVQIAPGDGGMYACAAGSSQFARCRVPGFTLPLNVPGAVLDDLVKLLAKSPADDAEVADAGSYVVFRAGPVTMAALKTTAAFPDVDSLFLKDARRNDMALSVDKARLREALGRVKINSDALTSAVALIADSEGRRPELTVTSRDNAGNSAEEVILLGPDGWSGGRCLLVVNAVFLDAMLAAYPSATCEFRVGKDRGKVRAPLLLEDTQAGVTGICLQMPPSLVGY